MAGVAPPLPYGKHQTRGRNLKEWINDAAFPGCPVGPCNLTWDTLMGWAPIYESIDEPGSDDEDIPKITEQLEIPGTLTMSAISHPEPPSPGGSDEDTDWRFYVKPGCLIIMTMFRKSGPYASQIAQVLYERSAPIHTLKQVIAINVGNEDTVDFIKNQIYTAANGLVYPPSGTQTFVYGTAEYEGLLGTRIGSVVAYLILGAFKRGTRRISQITVGFSENAELNLHFDIVKFKAPAKAKAPAKIKAPVKKRPRESDGDGGERKRKRARYIDESYDGPAKRTRLAVRTAKRASTA